jgi:CDP-glucose 4,6-dehydratase
MDEGDHPHEASTLKLDCSKAAARLGWLPILRLEEALMMTADWYQERRSKTEMRSFTCAQIEAYEQRAEAVANHGARQGGECA